MGRRERKRFEWKLCIGICCMVICVIALIGSANIWFTKADEPNIGSVIEDLNLSDMYPVYDEDGEEMFVGKATFYDYYSNSQVSNSSGSKPGTITDGGEKISNQFTKFNDMLIEKKYWSSGTMAYYEYLMKGYSSVTDWLSNNTGHFPLYLGLFYPSMSSDRYPSSSYNIIQNKSTYRFWMGANSAQSHTSTPTATQGLVDSVLKNGQITQRNTHIILPYFDKTYLTTETYTSRPNLPIGEVTENVSFPFRESSNNYYVFDSSKDVVRFNSKNQLDYFYDNNSVRDVDGARGFFPYNNAGDANSLLNFGFGMKLEIPFNMTADGMINGDKINFDFKGDDDVWVFIDGYLALDIGGAHAQVSGSIDFKNKRSTVSGVKSKSDAFSDNSKDNPGIKTNVITDFPAELIDALKDTSVKHTLTMFYMERGTLNSNLYVKFNLPQISTLSVATEIDDSKVNDSLKAITWTQCNQDYFQYTMKNKGTEQKDVSSNVTYNASDPAVTRSELQPIGIEKLTNEGSNLDICTINFITGTETNYRSIVKKGKAVLLPSNKDLGLTAPSGHVFGGWGTSENAVTALPTRYTPATSENVVYLYPIWNEKRMPTVVLCEIPSSWSGSWSSPKVNIDGASSNINMTQLADSFYSSYVWYCVIDDGVSSNSSFSVKFRDNSGTTFSSVATVNNGDINYYQFSGSSYTKVKFSVSGLATISRTESNYNYLYNKLVAAIGAFDTAKVDSRQIALSQVQYLSALTDETEVKTVDLELEEADQTSEPEVSGEPSPDANTGTGNGTEPLGYEPTVLPNTSDVPTKEDGKKEEATATEEPKESLEEPTIGPTEKPRAVLQLFAAKAVGQFDAGTNKQVYQSVKSSYYELNDPHYSTTELSTGSTDSSGKLHLKYDQTAIFHNQFSKNSYFQLTEDKILGTSSSNGKAVTEDPARQLSELYTTKWAMQDMKVHLAGGNGATVDDGRTRDTGAFLFSNLDTASNAEDNTNLTVIFTNTIQTGDIEITKELTEDAKEIVEREGADPSFEFEVTLKNVFGRSSTAMIYNGIYDLIDCNGTITQKNTVSGKISIKVGERAIIKGIPVQTEYTIREIVHQENDYYYEITKVQKDLIIQEEIGGVTEETIESMEILNDTSIKTTTFSQDGISYTAKSTVQGTIRKANAKDRYIITNDILIYQCNIKIQKTIDELYYNNNEKYVKSKKYEDITKATQSFVFRIIRYEMDESNQLVEKDKFDEVISFAPSDGLSKEVILKDLEPGYYVITEDTEWSWKYAFKSVSLFNDKQVKIHTNTSNPTCKFALGILFNKDEANYPSTFNCSLVSYTNQKQKKNGSTDTTVEGDTTIITNKLEFDDTNYVVVTPAPTALPSVIDVTSIAFISTDSDITVGGDGASDGEYDLTDNGTLQLAYTIKPSNATDKTLIWTSSDTSVATVVNGKVTAVGTNGEASAKVTITATTSNGISASYRITISQKTYLIVDANSWSDKATNWDVGTLALYSGTNKVGTLIRMGSSGSDYYRWKGEISKKQFNGDVSFSKIYVKGTGTKTCPEDTTRDNYTITRGKTSTLTSYDIFTSMVTGQ